MPMNYNYGNLSPWQLSAIQQPTLGSQPVQTYKPKKWEEEIEKVASDVRRLVPNGDDNGGQGPGPGHASFANPQEAKGWNQAGWNNNYFGTVPTAIEQANAGNQKAQGTLDAFAQQIAQGKHTGVKQYPGVIGKVLGGLFGMNAGVDNTNIRNTLQQQYQQGTYPSNIAAGQYGLFSDSFNSVEGVHDTGVSASSLGDDNFSPSEGIDAGDYSAGFSDTDSYDSDTGIGVG